jgi:hypothetical protein
MDFPHLTKSLGSSHFPPQDGVTESRLIAGHVTTNVDKLVLMTTSIYKLSLAYSGHARGHCMQVYSMSSASNSGFRVYCQMSSGCRKKCRDIMLPEQVGRLLLVLERL